MQDTTGAVVCWLCERDTLAPVRYPIDSASGPPLTAIACDRCARQTLAEHRRECLRCRSGVNCETAAHDSALIEAAAEERRTERQARR